MLYEWRCDKVEALAHIEVLSGEAFVRQHREDRPNKRWKQHRVWCSFSGQDGAETIENQRTGHPVVVAGALAQLDNKYACTV